MILPIAAAALAILALARRKPSPAPPQGAAAAKRRAAAHALAPQAAAAARQLGLPWLAQLGLAQGLLETGWGRAVPGNNWFGIKGVGPAGSVEVPTREEFTPGQVSRIRAKFRAYPTAAASVADWAQFVTRGRYAPATRMRSPAAAALWIWAMGYATAGRYVPALAATARSAAALVGDPELGFTLSPAQAILARNLQQLKAGKPRRAAAVELLARNQWPN